MGCHIFGKIVHPLHYFNALRFRSCSLKGSMEALNELFLCGGIVTLQVPGNDAVNMRSSRPKILSRKYFAEAFSRTKKLPKVLIDIFVRVADQQERNFNFTEQACSNK